MLNSTTSKVGFLGSYAVKGARAGLVTSGLPISEVLEINGYDPEESEPWHAELLEKVMHDIAEFRAHDKHAPECYGRHAVMKAQAELLQQEGSEEPIKGDGAQ